MGNLLAVAALGILTTLTLPAQAQTWIKLHETKLSPGPKSIVMDWLVDANSIVRQGKYAYINIKIDVFDGDGRRVPRINERGPVTGDQVNCETKQVKIGANDWSGVVGDSLHEALVEFACR